MTKTFILNLENLDSQEDAQVIESHFLSRPGIEKVGIELSLKLVSLYYNEAVGSTHKLLEAFGTLGYQVR